MIILGITGSIGMGKSTIGNMLKFLGVPVHDSDACVHRLMTQDQATKAAIAAAFPAKKHRGLYKGGAINRTILGKIVFKDITKRKTLEKIIHPRVRAAQTKFIASHRIKGTKIIALDIPLLFETGGETLVDYTLTVTAPPLIQEQRVLARPNMDAAKFQAILAHQMPSREKERRADYIIQTGIGRAHAMQQLKAILRDIDAKINPPPPQEKVEKYYTYS